MAVNLALDTNAYTRLLAGARDVILAVSNASRVIIPVIVLGELKAGFACGVREVENLRLLQTFLQSPKVAVLGVDFQTTEYYASLYSQLRRQGTPIPLNDLWIAALVVQHHLTLCSDDKHFDCLPQISRC